MTVEGRNRTRAPKGLTRRDPVEIADSSAAVWRFRDGKLARAEFYIDRDTAREAFAADS
jgi:ketosteroid isomerase-like protein